MYNNNNNNMDLAIELIKNEIAQIEHEQKHEFKKERQVKLTSLYKALKNVKPL